MSILLGKAVLRALRSVLRALTYTALTSSQSVEVRRRSPPPCWHIFAKSVGSKDEEEVASSFSPPAALSPQTGRALGGVWDGSDRWLVESGFCTSSGGGICSWRGRKAGVEERTATPWNGEYRDLYDFFSTFSVSFLSTLTICWNVFFLSLHSAFFPHFKTLFVVFYVFPHCDPDFFLAF